MVGEEHLSNCDTLQHNRFYTMICKHLYSAHMTYSDNTINYTSSVCSANVIQEQMGGI